MSHPRRHNGRMNINEMISASEPRQMELTGVPAANGCRRTARRQIHASRATWWFNRMRQVVDNAADWEPSATDRTRN